MAGGKSRKSGGVSKALINKILGKGKKSCGTGSGKNKVRTKLLKED
jgi:hypothetical protein